MTTLLAAFFLQAQSQPMVPPTSSEWVDVYDPPYKVPTELPADSTLRGDLFDLLRVKVTPQHRFTGSLKVYRNWALFVGATVDKKGEPLKHPPHDNTDSVAIWLRTSQGWRLIDFSFGHSDAFYLLWSEKYGVPAELIGITTKSNPEQAVPPNGP
jgi:hypothetical protein